MIIITTTEPNLIILRLSNGKDFIVRELKGKLYVSSPELIKVVEQRDTFVVLDLGR